jgi:hypothetical protein
VNERSGKEVYRRRTPNPPWTSMMRPRSRATSFRTTLSSSAPVLSARPMPPLMYISIYTPALSYAWFYTRLATDFHTPFMHVFIYFSAVKLFVQQIPVFRRNHVLFKFLFY